MLQLLFNLNTIVTGNTVQIDNLKMGYSNDNSVVRTLQVRLCELDYHICFLNDHVGDLGTLETTLISNARNIATLKTNIPLYLYL
jgi:hypothetical protein